MKSILHVMAGADIGGIAAIVVNYYRYINKEKFHFDVAITSPTYGILGEQMINMGMDIYFLPLKSKNIKKYEEELVRILKNKDYYAIHVHENETSYIALRIAKKTGIKRRFAHAHTSSPYTSIMSELRRLSGCYLNNLYATKLIGCGLLAGNRVFSKRYFHSNKGILLPNAIETNRFSFNEGIREIVRKELNLQNKFVIGLVGRLSPEKNQLFAVQIIEKFVKHKENAVILLVGEGEDRSLIEEYIKKHALEPYVFLLGRRNDVERLYQAFDAYILPSKHEGFPVSAVEAMASGLPVILSATITNELSFYDDCKYVPLNDDEWVEQLLPLSSGIIDRKVNGKVLKDAGFDIRECVKKLEKIYSE